MKLVSKYFVKKKVKINMSMQIGNSVRKSTTPDFILSRAHSHPTNIPLIVFTFTFNYSYLRSHIFVY